MRPFPASCAFFALVLAATPAGAAQVELLSSIPASRASGTANGASRTAALSADGRWAAFTSNAPNLVPGMADENNDNDVFLHDRATGETILVTRSADDEDRAVGGVAGLSSLSADGRYLAFASAASDLVPGVTDTGGADVFLYDRVKGTTELVSHRPGARSVAAGGFSNPVVSADGRWVAFTGYGSALVAGETVDNFADVYLWERRTGTIRLASRTAASPSQGGRGTSDFPFLSADGRYVAFVSTAPDLVPGQGETLSGTQNAFLFDRVSSKTVLIDHASTSLTAPNGVALGRPRIGADNRFILYTSSASGLVPGQSGPSGNLNVFLYERSTGKNILVSRALSSPTATGNSSSAGGFLSADGSAVLFASRATDLVPGQEAIPGRPVAAFLYTRSTGKISLISGAGGSATRAAGGDSTVTGISADGQTVLFESAAPDVVPGVADGNGQRDLFLLDRRTGKTSLVSSGAASPLTAAAGGESTGNLGALLSNDGQWIAFTSTATDLAAGVRDLNGASDVALQGKTGLRTLLSRRDPARPSATPNGASRVEAVSADGRFVVFTSTAADLLPPRRDANGVPDVYLADRAARTLTLVSRSTGAAGIPASGEAGHPRISADGRFVVYESRATNVVPGQVDTEDSYDVFLWDRATGATTLVSRTPASPVTAGFGFEPEISADGSTVAFVSFADDLVPGQTETSPDPNVFVWDRITGTTALASRAAGTVATPANRGGSSPSLDASGRFVAFASPATDLVAGVTDTNGSGDIFVFDRIAGTTILASHTAASPSTAARGESPLLSANGRFVTFLSSGTDLVAGQTAPASTAQRTNLFLWDRPAGVTRLVSHKAGSPATEAGAVFDLGGLSADGRFVTFTSFATDVVAGPADANNRPDVFLYDRETGENVLVSRAHGTARTSSGGGLFPKISADGRFVIFQGASTDLLPGGGSGLIPGNVFRYDRQTGAVILASRALAGPNEPAKAFCEDLELSANGAVAAFSTHASNLADRDFNRGSDGPLLDAFAAVLP